MSDGYISRDQGKTQLPFISIRLKLGNFLFLSGNSIIESTWMFFYQGSRDRQAISQDWILLLANNVCRFHTHSLSQRYNPNKSFFYCNCGINFFFFHSNLVDIGLFGGEGKSLRVSIPHNLRQITNLHIFFQRPSP